MFTELLRGLIAKSEDAPCEPRFQTQMSLEDLRGIWTHLHPPCSAEKRRWKKTWRNVYSLVRLPIKHGMIRTWYRSPVFMDDIGWYTEIYQVCNELYRAAGIIPAILVGPPRPQTKFRAGAKMSPWPGLESGNAFIVAPRLVLWGSVVGIGLQSWKPFFPYFSNIENP